MTETNGGQESQGEGETPPAPPVPPPPPPPPPPDPAPDPAPPPPAPPAPPPPPEPEPDPAPEEPATPIWTLGRGLILVGTVLALALVLVLNFCGKPTGAESVDDMKPLIQNQESRIAENIHLFVKSAILACHGIDDEQQAGGVVRSLLSIPDPKPSTSEANDKQDSSRTKGAEAAQPGGNGRTGTSATATPALPPVAEPAKIVPELTTLDRMVISLDRRLWDERARTADQLDRASERALSYQWIIIILGAITTILVGLNAAWSAHDRMKGIVHALTALVIVISATSTAVASYVTYLSPAAELASQQQRLAVLRNLHQNLVNVVDRYYGKPLCPMTQDNIKTIEPPPLPGAAATNKAAAGPFLQVYQAAYQAVDKIAQDFQAVYPATASVPDSNGKGSTDPKGAGGGGGAGTVPPTGGGTSTPAAPTQ